jgi:hypothetical protein
MATHDSKQARPEQGAGEETQPAGASKSPQTDDDPQRVNLTIDQRADDSGGAGHRGADEDRPRDGT